MARRRWRLILVRPGASRSLSLEGSRAGLAAAALIVLFFVGGLSFALGSAWGRRAEIERAEGLREEIGRLEGENARVVGLAARLDTLEVAYSRLRRAMSGEVAPSERDIVLPRLGGREGPMAGGDPSYPSLWPLAEQGFVTRAFGDTAGAAFRGHAGLDIAVPEGSYVRAAGAGRVSVAGEHPVYGRYLRLEHASGVTSLYAHNAWVFVAAGDSVERGEVVALSGNTGRSTAPHLHFEVERDGRPVDPMEFLAAAR